MSTYTYRFIEYLCENIAGSVWRKDDLPKAEEHIGETYRINEYRVPDEERYYLAKQFPDGCYWIKVNPPTKSWRHLKWYSVAGKRNFNLPSEEKEKVDYERHRFNAVGPNGFKLELYENTHWVNNGGHVRDDYISSSGWSKQKFSGRGLPDDVSFTVGQEINEEPYFFDKTYVRMDEWQEEFESLVEKFKLKIKSLSKDETAKRLEQKVDEILARLKGEKFEIPEPEEGEFDDFEEMLEEELWTILHVSDEIRVCDQLIDEFVPNNTRILDRRIIYCLG